MPKVLAENLQKSKPLNCITLHRTHCALMMKTMMLQKLQDLEQFDCKLCLKKDDVDGDGQHILHVYQEFGRKLRLEKDEDDDHDDNDDDDDDQLEYFEQVGRKLRLEKEREKEKKKGLGASL